MMTYEMVGVADQNKRTYESIYGSYNKERGFLLNEDSKRLGLCELLDKLFHENCWSLKQEEREMTKEEIEKALGYKIRIKNNSDCHGGINYKDLFCDDDIFSFLFK